MASQKKYHRPYPEPEARSFSQWCIDLGIVCEGNCPDANEVLTYQAFCFLSNVRLLKVREGALYGWWRKHGDIYGECRTVKEWLKAFKWELDEPTEEVLNEMNLFIGHDEFWNWSNGKVVEKAKEGNRFFSKIKALFRNNNNT